MLLIHGYTSQSEWNVLRCAVFESVHALDNAHLFDEKHLLFIAEGQNDSRDITWLLSEEDFSSLQKLCVYYEISIKFVATKVEEVHTYGS